MAGIRKWIRNKLDSKYPHQAKEGTEQQIHLEPAPLPYLPATCPRRSLTSPAECEAGHYGKDEKPDSPRVRLQNYGLFGPMPDKVRRQILVAAFGGRTLHMDLSYGHPLTRSQPEPPGTSSGSGSTHRHCGLGSELVPDPSRPQQWQWFGCVCHRRAEYSEAEKEQRYAAMEMSQSIEPCDDECLEGSESMCSCSQSGSDGTACFVGAMGWLLACRQAYADGIDVLYGANTFHISSLDLQLNLLRLVPPHHLAKISSLELLWKLNSIQARSKPRGKDYVKPLWEGGGQAPDSPLHVLCDLIPRTFPHLRRLYISFQCWLSPGLTRGIGGDIISEVETIFLAPVEEMMRACLRGRTEPEGYVHGHAARGLELNVAIQRGAWYVLLTKYHKLVGTELKVESVDDLSRGRFWKPLARVSDDEEHDGDDGLGYWICGGWEDMKTLGNDYWNVVSWGDKWTGVKMTY